MKASDKEMALMTFLEAEASRLHMNVPTPAAVRETIEFLSGKNPDWADEITPDDFAKILRKRYPELRFEWTGEEGGGLADEPATEKQIAYLKVLEVPIPDYLGIREASDLIEKHKNRMSEGQRRRLNFYKLEYDADMTREEANELIDNHKAQHPESEAAYQEWKARNQLM